MGVPQWWGVRPGLRLLSHEERLLDAGRSECDLVK